MTSTRVRATLALGIVLLLGLAAAGWFLVLGPRLATTSDIAVQIEQVEFSNTQLQNRYRQTVEQAANATQAAADAQALFATMPQQADLPAVLLQISEAAQRAGIDARQISVINASVPRSITGDAASGGDPASAAGAAAKGLGVELAQLDIDVTVSGSRESLLAFLDNLQGLDRAVLITSTGLMDMQQPGTSSPEDAPKKGQAGQQSLDVTGSMFVLQSKLPDIVAAVQSLIDEAGIDDPAFAPDAA